MVTIIALLPAIGVSAVLVWIASALVWMVLPHHKTDYKRLPDEEAARNALGPQNLAPGQYNIPHMTTMEECNSEEGRKKFNDGPVGFMTILPNRVPAMGKNMALTFVFYLVVGVITAYVAGRSLGADADYLAVFRLTGTVAFVAHGLAVVPEAIWFGRPWSSIIKTFFDALIYGLLTAGVFGWMWPDA